MPALVLDEYVVEQIKAQRKEFGSYRWDEYWDGVYVVHPLPDNRHDRLSMTFVIAFWESLRTLPGVHCYGHVSISDRNKDGMKNVRCPDAAVFLPGNPARDRRTHWQGGPDFLAEVATPGDRCREKLDFYAKIGTREVLIVDRDPWRLEMYHRWRGRLRLTAAGTLKDVAPLTSSVIPMSFQLVRRKSKPTLRIVHTQTGQEWVG